MLTLGVIGTGNMGEALLRGALQSNAVAGSQVTIFDTNREKAVRLGESLGVFVADSLPDLLRAADVLLLAVKPNVFDALLRENRDALYGKALISIAAGWSGKRLQASLPDDTRVLRVMPNTPALIGEGMTVFEAGDTLLPEEKEFATKLFSAVGKVETVDAKLMDAVIGVSGSGPAYVYMFIEALGDGGARAGLPRDLSYKLAAQTLIGAAKMVEETGRHPGELKDMVCSPGGTTIEAVATLEKNGLRRAVLAGVEACIERAKELDDNI
jgi:pyrroline-5-carboxylate reductase